MRGRLWAAAELLGPVALIVATGLLGAFVSNARSLEFVDALISTATVVALYVFVGNSGVLSFGQISFFIVGAYVAGEYTVPADAKPSVLPQVFSVIRDHTVGNAWSLVLATAVGTVFALVVGAPLMRLSGLAAGIATFAVLEITHNIVRNWEKIGPGPLTLSTVPETTDLWQATLGTIAIVCGARSGGSCARRARIRSPPRRRASTSTGSGCGRSSSRARCRPLPAGCTSTSRGRSTSRTSTSS